jgi:hypothetical protein
LERYYSSRHGFSRTVWLLISWLVFAGGVGFKCWTLTRLIRRQVLSSAWGMERFKAELERTWQRSGSARA